MEIPFIKQLALKQNINLAEVSIYVETFVLGFSAELQASGRASFDPFGVFEVTKELEYIKEEDGCKLLIPPRLRASFCSSAILGVLSTDEDPLASPLYDLFNERHEWEPEGVTLFIAQIKSVVKSALLKEKKCFIPGFGSFEGELGGEINFIFSDSFEELINKPFSHFKPVELSCSERDLKSADNSSSAPSINEPKEEAKLELPDNSKVVEEPVQPKEEEVVVSQIQKLENSSEPVSLEGSNSFEKIQLKLEDYDKRILLIEKQLTDKNKLVRLLKWTTALLSIIIIVFLILAFFYHAPSTNNEVVVVEPKESEQVDLVTSNEKTFAELEEEYLQQINTESDVPTDSANSVISDSLVVAKDSILPSNSLEPAVADFKNHTLKSGETLRSLALLYYNDKEKWTVIVQANSDIITDPNHIPIGTTLRIPN